MDFKDDINFVKKKNTAQMIITSQTSSQKKSKNKLSQMLD